MNITITQQTKHRLTGFMVVLAVAIIFVPAMIKKSNQRLEENIHVSVQLPPKPAAPNVAMVDKQAVFETVKIAEVTLPATKKPAHVSQIAQAEGLYHDASKKKHAATLNKPVVEIKPVTPSIKPVDVDLDYNASDAYAVQLALFSVQRNAENLVFRLRDQGYKAQYHVITSGDTALYRVTVGQLNDRDDAYALKDKLSESMQLKGFVIKRGVS